MAKSCQGSSWASDGLGATGGGAGDFSPEVAPMAAAPTTAAPTTAAGGGESGATGLVERVEDTPRVVGGGEGGAIEALEGGGETGGEDDAAPAADESRKLTPVSLSTWYHIRCMRASPLITREYRTKI